MASVLVDSMFSDLEASAKKASLQCRMLQNNKTEYYSMNVADVESWYNLIKTTRSAEFKLIKLTTRLRHKINNHSATLSPAALNRSWFNMREIASIYNIPSPISTPVTVGVISFGGGLYGSVDVNGVLTNGDIQAYWTAIGIPSTSHPKVIIKPINGASNIPNINDGGLTVENTIDIQTIGGACPSPLLTIIIYIAPNSLSEFYNVFSYIYNTPVVVNGTNYKPSIISCSWGAPEIYYPNELLTNISNLLATMTNAGINICTASGDNGSNNGVGGTGVYVDFPSSCPYVTAVGGTSLVSPNNLYDTNTSERAWSSGGGGISVKFPKPPYQNAITASGRSTPDIAAVADPNTGVIYLINSQYYIIGGTSVAAPIIASYLAAINCMVFINSRIYSVASNCFHDITNGSNGEYSARAGFDNCTGLGTINGTYLSQALYNVIATTISMYPPTLTLNIGQTGQLVATVNPSNTTIKSFVWTSGNTAIATVTAGTVTGVSAGNTIITATTFDRSDISTIARITVNPPGTSIPVTGVKLNNSSYTIHPSNTYQLIATVSPTNATNQAVTWRSNSPYATVSPTGLVTGVSVGTASITVVTADGRFSAAATFNITWPVTSISLSNSNLSVFVGQTQQLTATVLPAIAANKLVNWSSSNPSVATVSANGLVSGISNGLATITATTVDMGFSASASITVTTPVQSVTLNSASVALYLNESFQALATIIPATASNKNVSWASSNTSTVIVNSNGLITGVANGSAIISVVTEDGGKRASLSVTVSTKVTGVTIQPTLRLAKGTTYTLVPTINPPTASNKVVTWSTNNGTVATVTVKGLVTAIKAGTATIIVRTADGNFVSMCMVTVF